MTPPLRLKIPELLTKRGLTAWGLHKAAPDAITATMAYRLVRQQGYLETFPRKTLEALAVVLNCPPGDLLTFDTPPVALNKATKKNVATGATRPAGRRRE